MNHVHCVPSDCTISVQFMYIFYTFCTLYIERRHKRTNGERLTNKRTVDVRRRRTSTTKVVKAVSVGSQRLFVFETSSLPRLSEDAAARTKSKRALVGWFVGSKVGLGWWLFLRCFVASFLRSFVPSFLRSFVPSFLRSFVPSFLPVVLRSFVPSCGPSFLRSFLWSFVPSFFATLLRFGVCWYCLHLCCYRRPS